KASAGVEVGHRGQNLQCRHHRTVGIVLMGNRVAKEGQEAISRVVRDPPSLVLDELATSLLVGEHHLAKVLRIKTLGKIGRSDEVTEHHGEVAPFTLDLRGGGVDQAGAALSAEPTFDLRLEPASGAPHASSPGPF